jgi:hypothetical protein
MTLGIYFSFPQQMGANDNGMEICQTSYRYMPMLSASFQHGPVHDVNYPD